MFLFRSWKTSLVGVVSFIVGGLVYNGVLTQEQANLLLFLIMGLLGLVAKDGNRTGV